MAEELSLVQVHAVAVSGNAATAGTRVGKLGAKIIEAAMSDAVTWCYQNEITDPEQVKKYMQVARENAKREILALTLQGNAEEK